MDGQGSSFIIYYLLFNIETFKDTAKFKDTLDGEITEYPPQIVIF